MSDISKEELIKHMSNISKEELIKHIFELSFALDSQSAGKDYVSLRNTHYHNQKWIHDKGLQEEYYQFFIERI